MGNNLYDQFSSFKIFSLVNISKKINSLMDIDQLLETIMESCENLLNTEGSSLLLKNENRKTLSFNVISGKGQELMKLEVPLGKGIAGIVAETGETLIINDAENDSRVFKEADVATNMVTRNILCVPINSNGKIIGVLEAINTNGRKDFNQDDELLLLALAEHAAIAITNRQLFNRVEARAKELSALYEISKMATIFDKSKDVLLESLNIVAKVMDATRTSILIFNDKEQILELKASTGINNELSKSIEISYENDIAVRVFRERKIMLVDNIDKDPRLGPNKRLRYNTKSFISAPMHTKQKSIGVLNITDKKNGKKFNRHDARLIETIANQISEVYENIRLYEQEKEKIFMERELEITRRIQKAIFPKVFPSLKAIDMYGESIPAKEVGGDFYDFFIDEKNPEYFSALIADVSGKSIPAALFMAICRSHMRAQVNFKPESLPANVLHGANKLIYKDSESAMFVTMFYFRYNTITRELMFSNGGHNPPLLVKSATKEIIELHTKGKPLSVIEDATFVNATVQTDPGDLLVLYTDGIVEANDSNEMQYGMERFKQMILENAHLSPSAIIQKTNETIKKFTNNTLQFDDITLFVFKFN